MPAVITPPTSGVHHQETDCRIFVAEKEIGMGQFFVTESIVQWIENGGKKEVTLYYPDIAIHAVCKDVSAFPFECLYIMYNGNIEVESNKKEATDNNDSEEENSFSSTEVRIVPRNSCNIKRMFDTMSDCQCLHPDEDDSEDSYEEPHFENGDGDTMPYDNVDPPLRYEDGAGEGFYTTEEGFQHLTPQGQETLQRLEQMLASSNINGQINDTSNQQSIDAMQGAITESENVNMNENDESKPGLTASENILRNTDLQQGQFDDA